MSVLPICKEDIVGRYTCMEKKRKKKRLHVRVIMLKKSKNKVCDRS